jgi:hypothetical protein
MGILNMKRCNIQNIDLTNEHKYSKEYGDPADFVEKKYFTPIFQNHTTIGGFAASYLQTSLQSSLFHLYFLSFREPG